MQTLNIKLKQHTPLIHFQHDQQGATLRASEVKPKLDKFILTKIGKGDYQAGIAQARTKGWLVGKGEHPALDYRMRIVTTGEPKEYLVASLFNPRKIYEDNKEIRERELPFRILGESPFFAQEDVNAGTRQEKCPVFLKRPTPGPPEYTYDEKNWGAINKKGLMWDDITISIFSTNQELILSLDSLITEFFVCTNFGTRSTKGFGSFTRQSFKESAASVLANNFKFVYKKQITSRYDLIRDLFKIVKADYQVIKSGVNHRDYSKSILFCYAIEKMDRHPRWEKRFFKKAVNGRLGFYTRLFDRHHAPILDTEGTTSWEDPEPFCYQYLRILLGFAEQFEFLLEYKNRDGEWKRDNRKKLVVKPTIEGVERFSSPILIKIIGDTIYLVGNDVDSRIIDKEVHLEYSIDNRPILIDEVYITIKTPASFDLCDFMNFAMDSKFNLGYTKVK